MKAEAVTTSLNNLKN